MIVIVRGLPGVGKTTFTKKLTSLIKAIVLSTDKIGKEIIASPPTAKTIISLDNLSNYRFVNNIINGKTEFSVFTLISYFMIMTGMDDL